MGVCDPDCWSAVTFVASLEVWCEVVLWFPNVLNLPKLLPLLERSGEPFKQRNSYRENTRSVAIPSSAWPGASSGRLTFRDISFSDLTYWSLVIPSHPSHPSPSLGVLTTMGLTTMGFYNHGSYKRGLLQAEVLRPGVFQPGVLEPKVLSTRRLSTRVSYSQGSFNHGFL